MYENCSIIRDHEGSLLGLRARVSQSGKRKTGGDSAEVYSEGQKVHKIGGCVLCAELTVGVKRNERIRECSE